MKHKYFLKSRFAITRSSRLWTWFLVSVIVSACLLFQATTAHAFPVTQCAANRFGSDLNCTAGDVSITGMRVVGDVTSCVGGTNITVDLEFTVNFATPDRYDIGIFISNDGRGPQFTVANGGAASCSVGILPPSSPFLNLELTDVPTDTCGDGNTTINGNTGSGILYMTNVTLPCQAVSGSGGNLYIPFVASWDHRSGNTCTSIADPVPGTKSKCNSPIGDYFSNGIVQVVVLPDISIDDNRTTISSGETVNYTVVIKNDTVVALSNIVFKDPAVTNINVTNVSCSGTACPCGTCSIADMRGAGITIPSLPAGSSVTFSIIATLTGTPPDTLTNTATVTVGSQTNSASDTDTIVGAIAILPSSLSKSGSPGTPVVYTYTLYNFSGSTADINLSAISSQGWPILLSLSSVTLAANASTNFTVTVTAGGAIGTVDITTINATSSGNTATATAITTVSNPLTITPNNIGSGGKGSSAFYNHRVQNNTASSQTVTFSTVLTGACTGWTAGVYKADKVTQIPPATVTLPPFGGYEDIAVKVNIPSTAAIDSTCTVTVTASAGGNTHSATDATTVKGIVLYSDPGFTDESYIFPAGNRVYARTFGALAVDYNFYWYNSSSVLQCGPSTRTGPGILPNYCDIPVAGPLGTWLVVVRRISDNSLFAQTNFYVGPDHLNASYTGTNPAVNTTAIIPISLHDRYNHVVPLNPNPPPVIVQGNPPTTKDPLKITVTVSGSATITEYCNPGCVSITPTQTATFNLSAATGTATITITDSVNETVTITPSSYNSALYGSALSPTRDESTTVKFVPIRRMRILDWREIFQ